MKKVKKKAWRARYLLPPGVVREVHVGEKESPAERAVCAKALGRT